LLRKNKGKVMSARVKKKLVKPITKPIPEEELPSPLDERILELPATERLPALLQRTGINVTIINKKS